MPADNIDSAPSSDGSVKHRIPNRGRMRATFYRRSTRNSHHLHNRTVLGSATKMRKCGPDQSSELCRTRTVKPPLDLSRPSSRYGHRACGPWSPGTGAASAHRRAELPSNRRLTTEAHHLARHSAVGPGSSHMSANVAPLVVTSRSHVRSTPPTARYDPKRYRCSRQGGDLVDHQSQTSGTRRRTTVRRVVAGERPARRGGLGGAATGRHPQGGNQRQG